MRRLLYAATLLLPAVFGRPAATQPDPDEELDLSICKDYLFLLDKDRTGPFNAKRGACPAGYQLARLADPAAFNHAAIFLFSCLGPSQGAWIATAMGTIYAQGDPVKFTSPDAIEKGGPMLHAPASRSKMQKPRKSGRAPADRRSTARAAEKQHAPAAAAPGTNVKTVASVQLDSPESLLPSLCQLIEQ